MSFVRSTRMLATRGSRVLQSRAYSEDLKLTFAASNKTFFDNIVVKQVDVPSFSGSFGILAKHVPTLAVLKPGVVQVIDEDGVATKYFVSSGSITVNEDSTVQVLAEQAHELEEFDKEEAKYVLEEYKQALSAATTEKDKAEATIALECAEAIVQAVS